MSHEGGIIILIDKNGHMVSDRSLDELHAFAQRLQLKREWFQNKPRHPHYDLTTARAKSRAIAQGAVMVNATDLVRRMVRQ